MVRLEYLIFVLFLHPFVFVFLFTVLLFLFPFFFSSLLVSLPFVGLIDPIQTRLIFEGLTPLLVVHVKSKLQLPLGLRPRSTAPPDSQQPDYQSRSQSRFLPHATSIPVLTLLDSLSPFAHSFRSARTLYSILYPLSTTPNYPTIHLLNYYFLLLFPITRYHLYYPDIGTDVDSLTIAIQPTLRPRALVRHHVPRGLHQEARFVLQHDYRRV